jgi:hypothetical protein
MGAGVDVEVAAAADDADDDGTAPGPSPYTPTAWWARPGGGHRGGTATPALLPVRAPCGTADRAVGTAPCWALLTGARGASTPLNPALAAGPVVVPAAVCRAGSELRRPVPAAGRMACSLPEEAAAAAAVAVDGAAMSFSGPPACGKMFSKSAG